MGLVIRERPEGWIVKPMRFHGPNMVICKIVSSAKRTLLIGAYLPPSTLNHLPDLEEVIKLLPGSYPIVMEDLNAEIGRLQNPRNQQVAYFLEPFVLVDIIDHFRQRLRFRHMNTWWKVQQRKLLHII